MLESDPYLAMIEALSVEIAKLESEISSDRAALNRDTLSGTNRIIISQGIDNKIRELDSMRQKLVSLELASINSYSQQFNKNIGTLNDSIKSLDTTNQNILKSSTRLERWTTVLIIVAIGSISVALYPISWFSALLMVGVAIYGILLLLDSILRKKK